MTLGFAERPLCVWDVLSFGGVGWWGIMQPGTAKHSYLTRHFRLTLLALYAPSNSNIASLSRKSILYIRIPSSCRVTEPKQLPGEDIKAEKRC